MRGFADLTLARQEDEHIAGIARPIECGELFERRNDRRGKRSVIGVVGVIDGAVEHLNRVRAAGNFDNRHLGVRCDREVIAESLSVDRGRGDDEFEIGSLVQNTSEIAQQEIDVETALVGFVDNDGVVLTQQPIGARLSKQDAVGHEFDERLVGSVIAEADLVANFRAERNAQLTRDPIRDGSCRQPPRLRVPDHALNPHAHFEQELWDLGGLARTRLAADDDDLRFVDGLPELVEMSSEGQVGGVLNPRHTGPAALDTLHGFENQAIGLIML